jgi:FkbM family methyltransferase
MIKYLKESFRRKSARRFTKEYPAITSSFNLEKDGIVEFANWDNPLVSRIILTQTKINFFKQFIKEGDLVIDIGANTGDTTVPMGIAAGKTGTTLGFDPNPYVYKILEANTKLNKERTNIVAYPCAISTEENEFYFISSEASFANGGISISKDSYHGKFIAPNKIKGVNLHELLKTKYQDKLNSFSFIKIDTEGYDKEIIKSISDLIAKYKPVIVAESFGKSSDEAKMELFEVIDKHGYDIFYFEDFEEGTDIRSIKFAQEMTNWDNTIDIYAIPKK